MTATAKQRGFSLTEVLLATGILAVGFVMIAMVFPVGIWLTAAAAERTIGPNIAREAAAKVQLYGLELASPYWISSPNHMKIYNWPQSTALPATIYTGIIDSTVYTNLEGLGVTIPDRLFEESFYPSLPAEYYNANTHESRRYRWTALGLPTGPQDVRLVVFVCRRGAESLSYAGFTDYDPAMDVYAARTDLTWPMPVRILVTFDPAVPDRLVINSTGQPFDPALCGRFFTDGCEIVDDKNGNIYRVLERRNDLAGAVMNETLVLVGTDEVPWETGAAQEAVWVVPPAIGGGKNPCIGVYTWDLGL